MTIVDIGISNTWSILSAFRYLGADPVATSDPAVVAAADTIVLPGVGSYRRAMDRLHETGLADAIIAAGSDRERRILGICLGMQLLGKSSTEDGSTAGLGLIPGTVDAFTVKEVGQRKVPHVGFNTVDPGPGSVLFAEGADHTDFYFVHSYRMLSTAGPGLTSWCAYGVDFVAAYEHENIFATQFHPEKSQASGLQLLANFLGA